MKDNFDGCGCGGGKWCVGGVEDDNGIGVIFGINTIKLS